MGTRDRTNPQPIRVVVADDQRSVRQGLRALIETYPDIDVVGEARRGDEAVTLAEELRPNVVLMDCNMATADGLSATREIKRRMPATRVVVLTMNSTVEPDARASGADAFLVKGCPTEDLLAAIRRPPPGAPWVDGTAPADRGIRAPKVDRGPGGSSP